MDFKAFVKKQGVAVWLSLVVIICAVVGVILYASALGSGMDLSIANGSQPFYQKGRNEDAVMMATVVPCVIIALVALVASIVLDQFSSKEGMVGKVMGIAADVLRMGTPVCLFIAALYFVYGSFTGIGWTFFSNAELEIFPQAIATGKKVIVGIIFLVVGGLISVVSSFFAMKKPAVVPAE